MRYNTKMRMLEKLDVVKLYSNFSYNTIAFEFDCSVQFVKNTIMRQEAEKRERKKEMNPVKGNFLGAWQELKETELFQRLMNK